jgi:hypothetical protein
VDAVLDFRLAEIDEQVNPTIGELQIREDLGDVDWQNGVDRLDLDNYRVIDQ